MEAYQREFIELALARGALRFGEFVLKSGRTSPYFFNTGSFDTGASLARLARYYAAAIAASGIEIDALFGPAYKGVPLVAAVAVALAEHHGRDLPFAFNRKEAKDHGEGGRVVGGGLAGRVLVVDDVISAGTATRESIDLIREAGARCVGVAISLDRQERGQGSLSAIQEVEREFGLRVVSIVRLDDLVAFLRERPDMRDSLARVAAYREAYGAGPG